jgi:prophage DNA circulation protein
MSILSGFQRTTIAGVEVYFQFDEIPNLGRKTAKHEFINSKSCYVEDLGGSATTFNVKVRIVEQTFSAYKAKRNKLEKAINTGGIIVFVHPTRGRQKVVPTINTTSIKPLTDLNVIEYGLTLQVADKNIFPTSFAGNKNFLNRLYDSIFGENEGVLAGAVDFYNQGLAVFNDARDTIQDISGTINDVVSSINGTADEVAAFVADIAAFQASITNLMQTPSNLASRMTQLYNNVSVITDNFGDLFTVALKLVGAGSNRKNKDGNSQRTETINSNNDALYNFNDTAALSIAYQASTAITYTDQEQLNSVQKNLDDAYLSINTDTVDEGVYNLLQSMRSQNRLYLETLRLSLPIKVTLPIYTSIPATVLAYQLYGDATRSDEIVLLNKIEDPAFVKGVINVLSD